MTQDLPPEKKIKASQQVAEMLRNYILQGVVPPGEMLPPERTLATRFKVTRTTLREALKTLEQLKLIVIHQGQGITVRDFRNASMDLLTHLMREGDEINFKIVENIMETRVLLGGEVARLAALRAAPEDLTHLEKILQQLAQSNTPENYMLLDFEFFYLLGLCSKNMVYILLMNTIKSLYEKQVALFKPLAGAMKTKSQQAILEAVKKHEPANAERLAREYLTQGITLWHQTDNK
ncbi:MAG: FadR family transcriptional regulator [SAR324 cluster bacterium]|nr:FadR family transcriptional regulator [SAR324 cluster bacterium]